MKTRKFLWAVLPMMAAALALTACGGDDTTDTKPVPVSPTDNTDKTEKSVPYTVTVKGDPETTRATVSGMTMNFADGDKLYVKNDGGDIHGVLFIQSGAGSGVATFSGTLYYDTTNPPSESTSLTATLVSSNDQVAQKSDGKVTGFTYPTTDNVCSTLAEAVSGYSQLTGTGNYGSAEIVLYQSTAFLKFTVTLEDGTIGGASVLVSVTSDGSTTIGTGSVTTSGSNRFFDIQTEFYVPVAGGTVITKEASMCVANVGDDDESITYGASTNKKLTGGNVYTVSKTKDFVRLWADGPVWRTRNVGATNVTDVGYFYQWAGIEDVTNSSLVDWNTSPYWVSTDANGVVKYSRYVTTTTNWGGDGSSPDGKTEFADYNYVDDAATSNMGSSWRMPTYTDFKNLLDNTAFAWITNIAGSGHNGAKFTGQGDYEGKSIFLTAKGGSRFSTYFWYMNEDAYYWASSLYTSDSGQAWGLQFKSSGPQLLINTRRNGHTVRAVRKN